MGADQRVADAREFRIGLRRLAGRADDDAGGDALTGQARLQRRQMQRRDVGIGDDGAARGRREGRDPRAGAGDQALADEDRIGAVGERHWHLDNVGAGRRQRGRDGGGGAPGKRVQNGLDHGVMRPVARFHGDIRQTIDGRPLVEQLAQRRFGIFRLQQRPVGALAHAAHQHVEVGFQPDRNGVLLDTAACGGMNKRAAASGDDARAGLQQAGHHFTLTLAEIGFAMFGKNFRYGHAVGRFDFSIGIKKIKAKACGQPLADGGFSSPHHADKH